MAKLDKTVMVRAADPRCDHAHQTPRSGEGSGLFYLCQDCGAFIDYAKAPENLDAA